MDSQYSMDHPQVNEYCCARFTKDGLWFRAKILSTKHQSNVRNFFGIALLKGGGKTGYMYIHISKTRHLFLKELYFSFF